MSPMIMRQRQKAQPSVPSVLTSLVNLWPPYAPPVVTVIVPPVEPFIFDVELVAWLKTSGFTIYPLLRPERRPLPTIVYTPLDPEQDLNLAGISNLVVHEYSLSVYDRSYLGAVTTATQIRQLLNGYRGPIGKARVQRVVAGPMVTMTNAPNEGSASGVHQVAAVYRFAYRASPPLAMPVLQGSN